MNYCIIDESNPEDYFECEGHVLKTFFKSSGIFQIRNSIEVMRTGQNIEHFLKAKRNKEYNIVHFGAHGDYMQGTKRKLDYSAYYGLIKGNRAEIFKHDSVVRVGLKANIFLSTNCKTFNTAFIDIIRNYDGIKNYIAPVDSPYIGDTLIFSLMFYNKILRVSPSKLLNDNTIIDCFKEVKRSFIKCHRLGDFKLYNHNTNKIYG